MALLLNVPFAQKDEAKKLGARWNPELKKWYVSDRKQYAKFEKWLDGQLIVTDQIYIVEGIRTCYRCEKDTTVIGFGVDTCFDIHDQECSSNAGDICICEIDSGIPKALAAQLEKRYGFKQSYSKTTGVTSFANRCCHCHALQGNYFLFEEVDSPFFIDGQEAAEKLVLRRILLPYDISIPSAFWMSGLEDQPIRQYAKFVDSDLKWE